MRKSGRYLVYSSHILSIVSSFGEFVDNKGSNRGAVLQELPLINNLSKTMECLYSNLDGAREAVYYGLMPAMVHVRGQLRSVEGMRVISMTKYLNETSKNKVLRK